MTKTTDSFAGRGSIAGSSGDGGVEYRRGVVAYAVACGLSGNPLEGFGIADADAQVVSVAIETEDALDDIKVSFKSGWTALIQAKRTLKKGTSFNKAVAQWIEAAQSSAVPENCRLVIVGGNLSGTIRDIQQVLRRQQLDLPGPPTKGESEAFSYLDGLLEALTPEQKHTIFNRGVICELAVEETYHHGAQVAIQYIRPLVGDGTAAAGREAWKALISAAGHVARLRGGYLLEGWLEELRGAGVDVSSSGQSPAAEIERINAAIGRYKQRLVRLGSFLDLRGLGAQLPPLLLEESDADVQVGTGLEESSSDASLVWAFLRRGRVILTGLPGGGKTTAIRILAAQLCNLPGAPLPLCVSLKEVDALGNAGSFQDRLLNIAVRDSAFADRSLIRAELEKRLTLGGIVLLLDSLDETYDRRPMVVSQIDEMMADVSSDVDALLSTRDVAYGHAATLGWQPLRLCAPKQSKRIVQAILRHSELQRACSVNSGDTADWVKERVAWVQKALAKDPTLTETPLLPVLLALLAGEKDLDTLPIGRARVLAEVVREAVSRHELTRYEESPIGPLGPSYLGTAAMHAFAVEASAILEANGSIKFVVLLPIVAREVGAHWDFGGGTAEVAARDAIRFFDENGIFVKSGASETIAARVSLFAEIGDALCAITDIENINDWVHARICSGQFEPLILAAGLNSGAAEALGAIAGQSGERAVLYAAVRAYREGAEMGLSTVRSISDRLIEDLLTADPLAWESWAQLLHLPITPDIRLDIEAAVRSYDRQRQRQKLVRAQLDLKFYTRRELQNEPQSLLEFLSIESLPRLPVEKKSGKFQLRDLLVDRELHQVQVAAAQILTGVVPSATGLVLQRAKQGPHGLRDELRDILVKAGLQSEAEEAEGSPRDWTKFDLFRDLGRDSELVMLRFLASRQAAELTYPQQVRVDELADLLETLSMNDASSLSIFQKVDDIPDVINLTESLFEFDSKVIAAQAQLTIDRMEAVESSDPYYALFDNAQGRQEPNWSNIADVDAAVELLRKMMKWGKVHAWFVAGALWDVPIAEKAALMLRELLPELVSSPEHLRIGAHTLCSNVDGPEPQSWIGSTDPVLRIVAADLCSSSDDGHLTGQHRLLLHDPDGNVRLAAINSAAKHCKSDLLAILVTEKNQASPEWMCLSCRTSNPPGSQSCTKDGCFRSAPRVLERINDLLKDGHDSD
ncbi:NACHT domain-containing protein [Arthrobacter sp. TMN-49]